MRSECPPPHEAYHTVRAALLAEQTTARYWTGALSASALSTATAVSALALLARQPSAVGSASDQAAVRSLIGAGLQWLLTQQNPDGGWGDTDRSHSNIATAMLVRAAFALAADPQHHATALARVDQYIQQQGGVAGVRQRYGKDRTFSVPILTNSAIAGLVDWAEIPALPFEAACVPQRLYRWLRLPVVSYAIPALVAIGQAVHARRQPRMWPVRWLRQWAVAPSRRVLQRIQPASGGFLEAVPLTSFVVMSLASIGQATHPVTQAGLRFLRESVRPDGNWPIDTNLATWVTTLSLNALAEAGEPVDTLGNLDWLLQCQHRERHPYTGAAPGGWGWTDLSGAVPDADDTAGALLTLAHWARCDGCRASDRQRIDVAAHAGIGWLLQLQNRDGGWPTFCRGWGTLPFDRSGSDLTAHALRALAAWQRHAPRPIAAATKRGLAYLQTRHRTDGTWLPLWFGNQDHPREENPLYGTTRVLLAYHDLGRLGEPPVDRALRWLRDSQHQDGGWSGGADGPATVEETALAVEALSACLATSPPDKLGLHTALAKGLNWLIAAISAKRYQESAPIGFYFAKLWYYEQLYPLIFATAALGRASRRWRPSGQPGAKGTTGCVMVDN